MKKVAIISICFVSVLGLVVALLFILLWVNPLGGKYTYIDSDASGGKLLMVNPAGVTIKNKTGELKTYSLPANVSHMVKFSRSGDYFAVVSEDGGDVFVYDTIKGVTIGKIPVMGGFVSGIDFSRGDSNLVIANSNSAVLVWSLDELKTVNTFSTGSVINSIAINPGNDVLYVVGTNAQRNIGLVQAIDIKSGVSIFLKATKRPLIGVDINKEGNGAVMVDGSTSIYIIDGNIASIAEIKLTGGYVATSAKFDISGAYILVSRSLVDGDYFSKTNIQIYDVHSGIFIKDIPVDYKKTIAITSTDIGMSWVCLGSDGRPHYIKP